MRISYWSSDVCSSDLQWNRPLSATSGRMREKRRAIRYRGQERLRQALRCRSRQKRAKMSQEIQRYHVGCASSETSLFLLPLRKENDLFNWIVKIITNSAVEQVLCGSGPPLHVAALF